MTAAAFEHGESESGCVLSRARGIVVVLTARGPERASYGARMLGLVARDRSLAPEPGEWVGLRRWPDGPLTVEGIASRPGPAATLADVVPLRPHTRRL